MSRLEKDSSFQSAASTSQEGLEEGPRVSNQLLRVTLLSSEWRSLKGGLSTVNRELAIELAKHPNVEVCVYLPKCSEEDKKVAGSHNVQLIEAEELPGFDDPIDWLTSLPKGHVPHCLIGHGLHLGRQIQLIIRHHNCKWIQVVHTAPEELGMFKSYEEAISKGELKHQAEVKLCELADQVVAVGPKLADAYARYLRFSGKDQDVINLTPSIFTEFHSVQQATEERSTFCVLVFGRGDNEDFKLKGYDIAVQAVSELKDSSYQLLFVGAPTGKEDDVAAKLLEHGISPSQLTVRRFKESRDELAKLFCEVDLAIMPSRTEGFGLTALEALSAGLPVLVSGNSGLGDALKKVPSGFYHVVDSEDPKEWAKAIKIVRQKGREVRLEDANLLREKFASKYNWQKQCGGLVEKMLHVTFGSFSPGQPLAVAVDSSLSLSSGAPEEPVAVTFHHEEEGRIKQDLCQDLAGQMFMNLQQMQRDVSKVSSNTDLLAELEKIASDKGFVISNNEGSGNCMFYALSEQLSLVKEIKIPHGELRQSIVQYVRKNPKLPDGTDLFNFIDGHQSWADYLSSMEQGGTWGDHVILYGTANCYETYIDVISSQSNHHTIRPDGHVMSTNPLVLGHVHEVHYVSLLPKQATRHPLTAECNPVLSRVPSQSVKKPTHLETLHEGSSSTGQLSAVDSSSSLSHGACAAPEEPVRATCYPEEGEGGIKQDFNQGRSLGACIGEPFTSVECNPVPSHVPSGRFEKLTHLEVLHEGSVESRERRSKKGKIWLPSAVSQPRNHGKGHFRELLKEEYIRRSKLKPLLWENTIQLPLDEVYTRLQVKQRRTTTFQLTGKEIHMYEIFNLDKQEEKSGWHRRLRSMFGKKSHEKARLVLVEGSPGIGKTTFCLKIANDWARQAIPKKHDFPVFKLMLLLKCRDMDGDLTQAIDDQLLPKDMTEKEEKVLLDYIQNEKKQDKVLIILDGLDELPQAAEEAVDELLGRKVLSRCSILATSRQEKGIEIRQRHVFDTLLQINGFTIEDASEFIRKHFRTVGQSQADLLKGERLIQAIQENAFLHALRNNPLNLLLLCIVFEDHKGELPSNRTKLYQIIYRCLLGRYCSKYDISSVDKERDKAKTGDEDDEVKDDDDDFALEKQCEDRTLALGQLAWRCLLEERPSFRQKELDKLEKSITNGKGVSAAKVGVVFMEASVKKLNPKHEYHFIHRTFQEFLAATYLVQLMKESISIFDKFQLNKSDITSKYRQVFLFAAGILSKDGTIFFKHMGEILNRNWNWKSSEEDCRFVIELLNESGAPNIPSMAATVSSCILLPQSLELNMKDQHTLRLVRYAYEASSLASNVEPLQWINKLSLSKAHALSEVSASDLQRILNDNKTLKELAISTSDMTSLVVNTLLKGLSSNLSLCSLTLKPSKSIPADVADTLGTGLSLCNSLTTVKLKLFSDSNAWARDVSSTGLLKSTQLESVDLEYHGVPDSTAAHAFKLLVSKRSLISFSVTLFGDMEDPLASALSEGLSEETTLNSFTVVIHGSIGNHGATLLANSFLLNRTLQSLAFKVLGDLPEHWTGVVDKIHQLTANKSWKSLTLHPNLKSKFVTASFSRLNPISRVGLLKKTLTLNLWGELSIHNIDILRDLLLQTSPLSSLTLNVNGKVSNNVADCLVNVFVTNNVLLSLTLNLSGEITSSGQTALQRLHREGQLQSFILNVDGLVTDDWECLSAENNCSTSSALQSIDISNLTPNEVWKIFRESFTELSVAVKPGKFWVCGDLLCRGLSINKSLTTFHFIVHNNAGATGGWAYDLGQGLANNQSLTTFSLTVHGYAGRKGHWGYGLDEGLSKNKSLTTFRLTVHNYAYTGVSWGYGLNEGLANNQSLTTFSLTVHNYASVMGYWQHILGKGLAINKSLTTFSFTVHDYTDTVESWVNGLMSGLRNNKSLTSFSLTVHNYTDTGGGWGEVLDDCLSDNESLTSFSLTVHNYADAESHWGYGLGEVLSNNESLTSFSLTVHNYADTESRWGEVLDQGLSNNESLTTFSLTVHNYADTTGSWGDGLGRGLSNNKSLASFSLTVHNYTDTTDSWELGLGEGLSNNKSLATFSLAVHNYADRKCSWGYNMANSLANRCSLTTLRLAINDHIGANRGLDYLLCKCLEEIESLTLLSISVSFYGEDNVKLN